MADIDFSKYADPVAKSDPAGEIDFSKYADPAGPKKATAGGAIGAAAQGAGRGVLQGSGALAGGLSGATIGSTFGPIGTAVGGIGGAVAGAFAGEMASDSVGLPSPQQMSPELRRFGVAGESLGGAVPFAVAPFAAGAAGLRSIEREVGEVGYTFGTQAVGRFLNSIVNTAMRRPATTAAAEASLATSSATLAGAAESAAPGRQDIRGVAELVGGTNPVGMSIAASRKAIDIGRRALSSMSPAAMETQAAKRLSEILAVTGEDPVALSRALKASGLLEEEGVSRTGAQKTGSLALGALENHLARYSRQFGAEAAQMARDSLDATRGLMEGLIKTGDPAAISAAAELRQTYYRKLMTDSIAVAEREALTKAGKIAKDTPDARERLSLQAREALDKSIEASRAAEKGLWEAVDGTRPVATTNLQQTYDEIIADTLPELRGKKMPAVVRDFLTRVSKEGDGEFRYDPETMSVLPIEGAPAGTNAGEMRKLRSELLSMARAASRDPDQVGMERIYSDLAEAVLDDMDAAFRAGGDTAYDEARAFTREFNEVFTRTFVGKVTGTGKYGDRVAPEVLLRKALATGKEAGALQMQQLEEATRFLNTRGFTDDTSYRMMLDAQERIFRLAAADTVDPLTGRISPERVSKFIRDNPTLLSRFPEVKTDMLAAVKSEDRMRQLQNRAKGVEDIIARQGAFSSLLGANGNPIQRAEAAKKAAQRVLVSGDQEAEITRLINIAKGGGTGRGGRITIDPKESVAGLKAALYNQMLDNSRDRNGVLNIDQMRQYLTVPTSVGKKPLLAVMQEQGIVDAKEVSSLKQLFDAADNIARSQKPGTAVDIKNSVTDVATATLSRMIGSGAAGSVARMFGSSTPSLIVHGAGARLAEEAMTKIPTGSVNKVLAEAMMDPEKMTLLLSKTDDPAKAAMQARQIHAWLVQSGLIGTQRVIDREYERRAEPPVMFSR